MAKIGDMVNKCAAKMLVTMMFTGKVPRSRVDAVGKRMIHSPGGLRFHHAVQKGVPLETDELFISRTLHLIFFRPRLTAGN